MEIDELLNKIKSLGYYNSLTAYTDEEQADKNNYNYRVWSLPEENNRLKNTPFFYEGENDFLHFTSLESLYGILNSRHFRLYNLPNMDDKFEVEYARKELMLANTINNDDKEQLYCFSMCPSSIILNEEKKHLLWKLHGREGYGVIIRLKIMNDLASWCNYYLTKCFYTLKDFESIKQLNELTKTEILDPLLASFIKLPIYEFENEVRIVFNKRSSGEITNEGKLLYPLIYLDKLHKSDKISYFQLPIWNFYNDDDDVFFNPPLFGRGKFEMPKIAITEIILGYRYNEDDLKKLKDNMALYDSSINVKISDLKQYY